MVAKTVAEQCGGLQPNFTDYSQRKHAEQANLYRLHKQREADLQLGHKMGEEPKAYLDLTPAFARVTRKKS
ncbi:MAG: hypothetical protein WBH20_15765 [Oceanisphaera sp.]|uniref:hypothetical protein n=1 Tax=Oceanisphaera sp. TaxID=1929979 RepID=UPI003C788405